MVKTFNKTHLTRTSLKNRRTVTFSNKLGFRRLTVIAKRRVTTSAEGVCVLQCDCAVVLQFRPQQENSVSAVFLKSPLLNRTHIIIIISTLFFHLLVFIPPFPWFCHHPSIFYSRFKGSGGVAGAPPSCPNGRQGGTLDHWPFYQGHIQTHIIHTHKDTNTYSQSRVPGSSELGEKNPHKEAPWGGRVKPVTTRHRQ